MVCLNTKYLKEVESRVPGSSLLSATNITKDSSNVLTVNRTYDNLNRLTSIFNVPTLRPSDVKTFDYTYDNADRRMKCVFADGSYWLYEYDDLGQVTSAKKYSSSGTLVPGQDFGYEFDSIGNRTQCSIGVPACEYFYSANALNQYTQRTVPGIIPVIGEAAEDATVKIHRVNLGEVPEAILTPERNGKYFSEIIEVDNTTAPVEELLDVYCYKLADGQEIVAKESGSVFVPKTPEIYQHDADGNLLQDGRFTYSYDAENRMISAESSTGVPPVNRIKIEFTYDYMNRRTSCKVYNWTGSDWQLASTEKYVWDSYNLIATFTGSPADTLTHSYLWGEDLSGTLQGAGGVGGLIAETDHASSKSYLACYDGNGNIVAYLDSTGEKVAEFEYDPFGRTVSKSGIKADDFRFRFSTKPYRKETGMIEFQQRPYIPEIGRFPSRDPMGEQVYDEEQMEIKFNLLYGANQNNFINKFDRLGLIWLSDRKNFPFARVYRTDLKKIPYRDYQFSRILE